MPLSEHEQRLLDEMERNLYQDDAEFVAKVDGTRLRPSYRIVVLGILLAVVGIGVLLTGVFVKIPIVGILGFVLMLAGVMIAITPSRARKNAAASAGGAPESSARASHHGFMDRMGDRWDKRQDGS
jgi:hypothetical protein